jgi:hypothetical protein
MTRPVTLVVMAVFCITAMYSSPWEQMFAKYERWASDKTFVWEVEAYTRFGAEEVAEIKSAAQRMAEKHPELGEFARSLEGKNEYYVRHRLVLTIQNTTQGSLWSAKIVQSSLGNEWDKPRLFYTKDYCIYEKHYGENVEPTYYILPLSKYDSIPSSMEGFGISLSHPAFLTAANPFHCTTIVRAYFREKPPILEKIRKTSPTKEGDLLVFAVKEDFIEMMWTLDVQRDYRPARFVFKTGAITCEYRVLDWTKQDNHFIPKEIEFVESMPSRKTVYRFRLVEVSPSKPITFSIPSDARVIDLRLAGYISEANDRDALDKQVGYFYSGKIPSIDELKNLAYQRGNLIPPETPRRRYSPWLLLPAVLLFLAAGYLYFKNRRGHSARPNR